MVAFCQGHYVDEGSTADEEKRALEEAPEEAPEEEPEEEPEAEEAAVDFSELEKELKKYIIHREVGHACGLPRKACVNKIIDTNWRPK